MKQTGISNPAVGHISIMMVQGITRVVVVIGRRGTQWLSLYHPRPAVHGGCHFITPALWWLAVAGLVVSVTVDPWLPSWTLCSTVWLVALCSMRRLMYILLCGGVCVQCRDVS